MYSLKQHALEKWIMETEGASIILQALFFTHGEALYQVYVWNSASSELFVIGKSSLLAELGFTSECQRKPRLMTQSGLQ